MAGFTKIHGESYCFVLSRCSFSTTAKSESIGNGFAEPSVLVSATSPITHDLAMEIVDRSQSTSFHFSPAISLTRGPKNRATRVVEGPCQRDCIRVQRCDDVSTRSKVLRMKHPQRAHREHKPRCEFNGNFPDELRDGHDCGPHSSCEYPNVRWDAWYV